MKVALKFLLFIFIFSGFSVFAIDLRVNHSYLISSGSIETMEGKVFPSGTYVQINKDLGWAVQFRELDSNLLPIGTSFRASKKWLSGAVSEITPRDITGVVKSFPTASAVAAQDSCPIAVNFILPSNNAPQSPHTVVQTSVLKNQSELNSYFTCYQKKSSLRDDYEQKYRESIRSAARVFQQALNGQTTEDEINATMSCLIFRESGLWEGPSVGRGAVGLGQFTEVAIDEAKSIISYSGRDNFDSRIAGQRSERQNGRLTESQLQKNIASIEAERSNHLRKTELKRMWDSFLLNPRPTAGQINRAYLSNNSNHQAVMALTALKLRNCQIQLEARGINLSRSQSLLACSGAYNMGVGGFAQNALGRNGEQGLDTWIANLAASGSSQKNETINHLVSIHRCSQKGANYPQCGTGANYCKDLETTNDCDTHVQPQCVGGCRR